MTGKKRQVRQFQRTWNPSVTFKSMGQSLILLSTGSRTVPLPQLKADEESIRGKLQICLTEEESWIHEKRQKIVGK